MAVQNTQQNIEAQNLAMRRMLLASSPRNSKYLGSFDLTNGGDARIRLSNVGVITGLTLRVNGSYTLATANATLSDAAPYNVLRRVQLADYDGSTRVDCSGHHLWAINSIRARAPFGQENFARSAAITLPKIPVATGSNTFEYFVDVPLAVHPEQDLSGAILAQTGVGDLFLTLTSASTAQWLTNGSDDSVFNGAATTAISNISVSVDVYQNFLVARDLGNGVVPLPRLDLLSVYEIKGSLRTTANLATNTAAALDVPNVRKVIGAVLSYMNQGAYTQTDLDNLQFVVNSTNVLWYAKNSAQFHEQRQWCNADLGKSVYFFPFLRKAPVQTALIGNAQIQFTPAACTPASNTWLERTYESLYAKGSTLPGIAAGS
jgi:hypothetical protein